MTTADWPLIVDIKRHSLEDGPGIRSVVFFKGCALRCIFCQNPEAQDKDVEIAFTASDCITCGACADACEENAVDLVLPHRIHRTRCIRCGKCADACPGGALRRIGKQYSPQSLSEILLRDRAYYRHSGGGITLSGGESTMYPDYVLNLLQLLKVKKIHVAFDGANKYRKYEKILCVKAIYNHSNILYHRWYFRKKLLLFPSYPILILLNII